MGNWKKILRLAGLVGGSGGWWATATTYIIIFIY
jgi:hypothetical protein